MLLLLLIPIDSTAVVYLVKMLFFLPPQLCCGFLACSHESLRKVSTLPTEGSQSLPSFIFLNGTKAQTWFEGSSLLRQGWCHTPKTTGEISPVRGGDT